MDFRIDPTTGDLDISPDKPSLGLTKTDLEEMQQRVYLNLSYRYGEWFANIEKGIPYYQQFFAVKNNKSYIDNYMRTHIINLSGIVSLDYYSSTIDRNRQLNIDFSATIQTGETLQLALRGL